MLFHMINKHVIFLKIRMKKSIPKSDSSKNLKSVKLENSVQFPLY